MKGILVAFLLLGSMCYGQKNENYVLTQETLSNNKAVASKTTYFNVSINKSASRKEFPSVLTIKAIESKSNYRQPFHFSSLCADSNKNITTSTELITLSILLEQPIYFSASNKSTVIDTLSLKKITRTKLDRWKIKDEFDVMTSEGISLNAGSIPNLLFRKDISKDILKKLQTGPQKVNGILYRMTKKEGNNIYLSYQDSADTLNGELVIDKKTGQTVMIREHHNYTSNNIPYSATINMTQSEIPVKNNYDESYTDMLMKGAFFSTALNTDNAVDSVKAMQYITNNEKEFANDRNFIAKKLSLLQQIKNDLQYSLALEQIPVNLIAGTHHLSNILYRDKLTKDKFIALVPLLENNRRYDWIQNSLYQGLGRPAENEYLTADEQVELLINQFSETEKRHAYPMVLGQKIKNNIADLTLSKKLVSELLSLDQNYWVAGNAGRYALMAYQVLAPLDRQYAQQLLQDIIAKLTTLYNDDTKSNTKITRAHLATAYYLAYQMEKEADNAAAMAYLEKAAQYSPKSKSDMEYSSSYDIIFLKAKDSYADDYLKELAANGQHDIALQKYIDEFLNAQGSSYNGLRDFYRTNYPNKKFEEFFLNDVIPQLADAPDFTLTNLDSQKVSKSNLKGKWILIDFWGTWCGPCVAEMPKLNLFHEELKKDKSRSEKIEFITIACHDTESKVKSFLAKNKYSIPVLMSDNQVQKDFKVTGYPGKFIMTPTGKVMSIPFGFNWQPLLEEMASF